MLRLTCLSNRTVNLRDIQIPVNAFKKVPLLALLTNARWVPVDHAKRLVPFELFHDNKRD